ncbi:hypothetical protein M8845_01675 [Gelidibacter japonicus]|uniref:AbiJ-NTD4 domain-containing protein n=1 Tax=Gelidibacter japonicus TaxID=1962232 RepID=UPI002020C7EE|nr:hypothetical protein [Gelidibacter japonicus]MCL8006126.1 hypothetical protein [Gelidibacter japonicus]
MKFSQRIGKTNIRGTLQIDDIDSSLSTRLWNVIQTCFFDLIDNHSYHYRETELGEICKKIWLDFYDYRIDLLPKHNGNTASGTIINHIRDWYFECHWYEKYDLIEFLLKIRKENVHYFYISEINKELKKGLSGYRILNESLTQITSEEEIKEIEEALNYSSKWKSIETHLRTSLDLLSNRAKPDYRNSIKESISAVEAFSIIITNDKNASLGSALNKIEQKFKVHKALKRAFTAIYGYTSDSGGIRHSLLDDDIEITMEDARFMLISCSAFINYLKEKTEK